LSGDGVKECTETSSFLFPQMGGEPLPRTRDAKVAWPLKNPLMIFGARRDKLIVSFVGFLCLN
jgi:hypothetical protein